MIISMLSGGIVGLTASIATEQFTNWTSEDHEPGLRPISTIEPLSRDAETLATLASSSTSWYTIGAVLRANGPVSADEIASELAMMEGRTENATRVHLVHLELPKLDEQGVVDTIGSREQLRSGNASRGS